ncbi:hypothetical protein JCM5350_000571 [Sporobolomyces pararoseus]
MPVPRAARLASRKSVIPDPSLYGDPSDDSDEEPVAAAVPSRSTTTTTTTIKTTSSNLSNKKPRPSTTSKSTSSTINGKKKSSTSSTESLEPVKLDKNLDKQFSRSLNDTDQVNDRDSASRTSKQPTKRKRVEKTSDEGVPEQQEEEEDQNSRSNASRKPTTAQGTSKRTKVDQQMDLDGQDQGESASQASQTSSQRKGHFVPRAATNQTTRPNKPPPQFSAVLDGSDDDSAPFLFTTNPPTPHATKGEDGGTSKRPATKPKQNPKGKAPRIQPPENQTSEEYRRPPVASTSRVQITPPRTVDSDTPVTTHETPVQVRNIAFRQGVVGTPGTAAKSARRNSNGSARRGSSIGGGFTATPHPEIKNEELWRSTDPLLPIAARTRSIISWATQRDRTRLFDGKRLNDTEQVAKEVIDGFIEGICDLSIDTSVPFRQVQRPNPAELPPHPQNVANAAKKLELQEEFGAIAEEQNSRQTTSAVYSNFSARRATAREALSTSALTRSLDALSIAETFDLSRSGPKSLEEALDMGRMLLVDADVKSKEDETVKKKDRRKSRVDEENGELALDSQIRETLEDTAHLQQLTHRLSGFTRVVSRFIDHRSAETHQALTSQSLQGLDSTTTTSGGTGAQDSTSRTEGGAGLSSLAGVIGSSTAVGGGLDPLDLLRAISRADSSRR